MMPDEAANQPRYIAVYLSEATTDVVEDPPLFEESFVLVTAASLEQAYQMARERVPEAQSYMNALGRMVTWSTRLSEVGPVVDEEFMDGSEVYSRFFRNAQAYAELGFEDFERDPEERE